MVGGETRAGEGVGLKLKVGANGKPPSKLHLLPVRTCLSAGGLLFSLVVKLIQSKQLGVAFNQLTCLKL